MTNRTSSGTPVARARRSGLLLWLLLAIGGALFAGIHLALTVVLLGEFDVRVAIADAAVFVLILGPAGWYIRSITGERERHAAQAVLVDALSQPRNIADAARAVLMALTRRGLADAGVIALSDEHGDAQRVLAAIGYPEGWAKAAPVVRHEGSADPTAVRARESHPWVDPLGARFGKRPWVVRVPIVSNGDVIGLLVLVARRAHALRDPQVLATIAAQVGGILDHAALYEASYQRERDLEGQDQRRRDFLGALSHEIRTPLMSIQAFADLLRLEHVGTLDSAADELVTSLTAGVQRLNRLVTDLIDLGRSGGQEFEIRLEEVDARQALRSAEETLRPAFLLREQTVTMDLPDVPLTAVADPHRLEQVVLAVLSNAARHAPPSSEIVLRATHTEAGRVLLEIRDFGEGIAREDRERIFEPYFRARGPHGESVPGSGLGLAVARRLIDAQGGRIWVESPSEGGGACFRIEVRAAAVSAPAGTEDD